MNILHRASFSESMRKRVELPSVCHAQLATAACLLSSRLGSLAFAKQTSAYPSNRAIATQSGDCQAMAASNAGGSSSGSDSTSVARKLTVTKSSLKNMMKGSAEQKRFGEACLQQLTDKFSAKIRESVGAPKRKTRRSTKAGQALPGSTGSGSVASEAVSNRLPSPGGASASAESARGAAPLPEGVSASASLPAQRSSSPPTGGAAPLRTGESASASLPAQGNSSPGRRTGLPKTSASKSAAVVSPGAAFSSASLPAQRGNPGRATQPPGTPARVASASLSRTTQSPAAQPVASAPRALLGGQAAQPSTPTFGTLAAQALGSQPGTPTFGQLDSPSGLPLPGAPAAGLPLPGARLSKASPQLAAAARAPSPVPSTPMCALPCWSTAGFGGMMPARPRASPSLPSSSASASATLLPGSSSMPGSPPSLGAIEETVASDNGPEPEPRRKKTKRGVRAGKQIKATRQLP